MNDTTPNIAAIVRERLLARSGAERVLMGSRMFDVARAIALASFPPGLSEIETKRRLCERFYGNEVNVDAYIEHLVRSKTGESFPVTDAIAHSR
jgi:hypothetical protein